MKEINLGLLPNNKHNGFSIDAWSEEIENIFQMMPKIKCKVLNYLHDLKSNSTSNNYMTLKIEVEGKKKFEIIIKMSEEDK